MLVANRRAGNLVAKHAPRRCNACGRVFVPHSGRALYCRMCRVKGYKWIKEQMEQAQIKAEEVLENEIQRHKD